MKIIELEWIMKNINKLDEEDIEVIDGFGLREQYKTGELDYPAITMLEIISLCSYIYKKHNK